MKAKESIPGGHSLIPYLNIKNAGKAIEFYEKAFDAKELGRITMYGDKVGHAELQVGNSRFMIAEEMPEWGNHAPVKDGPVPVGITFYVEDVDATFKKAIDAGASVYKGMEPKDEFYGDRVASIVDPFGHKWMLATHIEDVSFEEMQKRSDKLFETQKQ